ncbi:hypothetical protein SteCoe_7354 [Stentor coeruleus]|uniref:Arb2 domain-containing protein n=1 Tax=Stentor coeruleus TaxID=5963 RepID=A0A1R2CMT7_9CILI|nr:hypothetical protein SteCoe_7354 [Stentor coeruleus]
MGNCSSKSSDKDANKPTEERLKIMGYHFDQSYRLLDNKKNEYFKFKNQKDYEKLGNIIQKYVQEIITQKYGLIEMFIPLDSNPNDPKCNIFMTESLINQTSNPKSKLLLLIQGSGAVRAGLWARSVCINDSLIRGTVFPFLDYAKENDFDVLIFNPNFNSDSKTNKKIKHNESHGNHGKYLWETFIRNSQAHDIYIVAHSRGGATTTVLMNTFWDEFKERVKAIAFTDAVHGYNNLSNEKSQFLESNSYDWVASNKPLDHPLGTSNSIKILSSGHTKHEYTTGSAYPSILTFFTNKISSQQ